MILNCEKTLACICPFCSTPIKKNVSAFDFSGNNTVSLKCANDSCGEVCSEITFKGKKYKITVECPFCADSHTFSVNASDFRTKKISTLKCNDSGFDIFFYGDSMLVSDVLDDSMKLYRELISENIIEENTESIMYDILARLGLLEHSHNIRCRCGSDKIVANIIPDGIVLQCTSCKTTKILPITEEALSELLNTDTLLLD